MEGFLTTAVFEQHQKHVDTRFDSVDKRFDSVSDSLVRIEAAVIAQGVKQDNHGHQGYVRWSAFVSTMIALAAVIAGVATVIVQAVGE